MAFPKLKTFIWGGVVLGALGPLLYYISPAVKDYILGDGIYLWPTGMIIIIAYGHSGDLFEYIVIAISIAANIGLFASVAAVLWLALSGLRGGANRTPL